MKNKALQGSLQELAFHCLKLRNPEEKVLASLSIRQQWQEGKVKIATPVNISPDCKAGIPDKPALVPFNRLPKRSVSGEKGHAALMHSFAHIEFNAINIAWDAVYRFPDMPEKYYDDWSRIAAEEAYHFQLIRDYLNSLGYDYGSFDAHGGLWEMLEITAHDVMVRMALVPRVLEARGLDVTPDIIKRFQHHKHDRAAEILEIIYRDEIGHVEVGSFWFKTLCEQRKLNAENIFSQLIEEYAIDKIRKPFNLVAREKAGFTQREMEYLNSCTK